MYESHWGLREKPFESTTDLRFYYPSETHQAAALKLRYAIESRRPGALLAGGLGVGKSLLVQWLFSHLPETFSPRIQLVYPRLTGPELLRLVANRLDSSQPGPGPLESDLSVQRIERALAENAERGHHAVLVLDEAQQLEWQQLDVVRLLMNVVSHQRPAGTVLLCGQPGLLTAMERFPALEERLGVKCLLRPLTLEESTSYVIHRLRVAGCQRTIFDPGALDSLYELSAGIPRRIDRLADLALLVAYAEQAELITSAHIEAVCDELVAVRPD